MINAVDGSGAVRTTSLDVELREAHAYSRAALQALLYVNSGAIAGLVALNEFDAGQAEAGSFWAIIAFGGGAALAALTSLTFFITFFLYIREKKNDSRSGSEALRVTAGVGGAIIAIVSIACSVMGVLVLAGS